MTVNEVSKLTGVSIRTLQYYDKIGLLKPTGRTDAGYRLYDDTALEKLQQILLFRELEFPLKEIKNIMESPCFDRKKALEQQITMLTLKKEHLENLISFARGIKAIGVKNMDFSAFDTKKLDEYAEKAKGYYGKTPEYREYEEKAKGRSKQQEKELQARLLGIFAEFGEIRQENPASEQAEKLVQKLQDFITDHFYTCTDDILKMLGKMYAGGGEFTENIDNVGGTGTAEFVYRAILKAKEIEK